MEEEERTRPPQAAEDKHNGLYADSDSESLCHRTILMNIGSGYNLPSRSPLQRYLTSRPNSALK